MHDDPLKPPATPATEPDPGMSYADYLKLDQLLSAQAPLSPQHDEMLFIVIHQATELWIKLMLHELGAARDLIRRDELDATFKMMARVTRVQEQLLTSWSVLSTLTPADYMEFRHVLGSSSGFQSHQYRALEFLLGGKNRRHLKSFETDPRRHAELTTLLESPSLYDEAIRLLAARGLAVAPERLERDWSEPYRADASVEAAWLTVYGDVTAYWDLYELAEKLIDMEDAFLNWRFRHLTTVERIIGNKTGTGGTPGVSYLRKALDVRFFPEIWAVRTAL